jgi:hypothetical protein
LAGTRYDESTPATKLKEPYERGLGGDTGLRARSVRVAPDELA